MSLSFALVDVAGVVHALDNTTGVNVAAGPHGLGMPPVAVTGDKLPYAPGAALRRISTPPSTIEVPIEIAATTSALLDALLDTVRGWVLPGTELDALPSTVKLRVTRADGAVREIEGVYAGGLEGDDLAGVETWHDAVLSLFCPDPYWSDAVDTTVTFTATPPASAAWFPYYPYNLAPASVFSTQDITNTGQVEAWPVWTINGPCSEPVVRNLTTGEVFALVGLSLAVGDVVTIDTRPRRKSVRRADGTNLWPLASAGSALWPLRPGLNSVRVELVGTTADSSAVLSYRRRWAGGHR
jgi:hypothetical protein